MQGKMIEMGGHFENLISLDPTNLFLMFFIISVISNNAIKSDHQLWHSYLEHPSLIRLNTLRNVIKLKDLVVHPSHCKVCHLAKQKWLPFPISNTITHSPFELIHLDIWGSFHHLTMKDTVIFLLLWMIFHFLFRFICCVPNLMSLAYFLIFTS